MRAAIVRLFLTVAVAAALIGCAADAAPTLSFPTPASAPPAAARPSTAGTAPTTAPAGQVATAGTLEIHAFDLGFKPSTLTVPTAGVVSVKFVNDGSTLHDLTFANGTKISAEGGKTATGEVDVPAGGLTFLCSIPGHADAGMKGSIAVGDSNAMPGMSMAPASSAAPAPAAGTPQADPNAPKYTLFDADRSGRAVRDGP